MSKNVIINRPLSESEVIEVKRLAETGSTIYAFSGNEISGITQQITFSPDEKRQVNYETMAEVLQFGDVTYNNQTISDLFRIDTASIWHYHKFRVYFAVRNLMYFLKPLEQLFISFENQIWFVSPEIKPLKKLYSEVDFRFPAAKPKIKFNFGNLLSYLILIKYRVFRYLISPHKNPEYLLYLTEKYSTVMDKNSLDPGPGHHILEYLISELDDRFSLLTEVLMPKPKGKSDYSFSGQQYKMSSNHQRKIFLEGFLLSGLLKRRVREQTRNAHRALRLAYPRAHEAQLSPIQKLTLEIFQSLDKSSRYYLFRYFAARKFFDHSGVKAVIAADENSPLTKSILDAAKFCGIKVVGLQHGTMHDLHPAYLYTENDRENRVMPDLTLTWGKYWEKFLIRKGNYPSDSVISVGQIRTDIIPLLLAAEKQKQAQSTDLIVFASQPQRDPELRYQAAFDVFKAVKRLPKSKLIVKLHPREFDDSDYYEAIAKAAGCTNYVLDTTSDLYQLIASCNVLITCFSTVGTETVYFHKPLIILDHLKQDIQGYVAEGVAFHATNSFTLESILAGIFRGTLKIDREKYDAFIEKYAYRIDGRVAERCIKAITLNRSEFA